LHPRRLRSRAIDKQAAYVGACKFQAVYRLNARKLVIKEASRKSRDAELCGFEGFSANSFVFLAMVARVVWSSD
jgi:hypothetical protein